MLFSVGEATDIWTQQSQAENEADISEQIL